VLGGTTELLYSLPLAYLVLGWVTLWVNKATGSTQPGHLSMSTIKCWTVHDVLALDLWSHSRGTMWYLAKE